ncbi:iron-containing alcohol dehydrogenase [Aureimonas jatrophae]|jgi:4-hydroxybutyrate dehydrogenase|uniref:Alcohol dehydrogenase 2 n=1 Tax=Aureimonas jatrophae TaxID=1166073 RepID=A0A1H0EHK6_9HYPH|nr:iron-containing alcohol dehydrogenase [Aureimonas jatrophae]MBB3952834.1 alcohol dehydrogenase class IV [Aureimonas jatrophae]SDN81756.1 Alcohol dehydrogenase, class IV [Aureimonas jatrophae]
MSLITYLTRIQFERGAVQLLAEELALLRVTRPLIITDKGVIAAGILDAVLEGGELDAPVIYDETPGNPTENAVLAARDLYRASGCDSVVAVGGGSPLDLAKAVSLLVTHAEPLEQYAAILGGLPRIRADKPPVIAIPTTSGTGSEVGRAALITLEDGRKLGFISPYMIPSVAICDPNLTLKLPSGLTAATGMDAVTHCIETYLSPRVNAPAEAIALDGLARAMRYLRRAYRDGSDIEAREGMMMASLEGGMTFQKGLGAVHGMSHALGGLKELRLHHGTLNAVILPAVLRFTKQGNESKYTALAKAMGLAENVEIADAIVELNADLDMPKSLAEMGVPRDVVPLMVKRSLADHSTATNGRPVSGSDYEALFARAFRA